MSSGTETDDWKRGFKLALAAYHADDCETALALFTQLLEAATTNREVASTLAMIGGIEVYELNRAESGEQHFRRCLELFPKSERPSLGLFHALMAQKRPLEALNEMRRFLELRPSAEYTRILKEMKDV